MSQHPAGRGRPSVSTLTASALIAGLAIVTVVGALRALQLAEPITEQARRIEALYLVTLAISLIVFFGVSAGLIWAIFRYRRRDDTLPEQVHGSTVLEAAWTIIPVIILVALFIPSLLLVLDLKQPPEGTEADIVVEVVGHMWWWEFVYPEQGISIQSTPPNYDDLDPPTLVLPVDQTVLLRVRSTDVVHSFSAPNTLYKIQAIPGNVNLMHFTIEKVGTYHGQCYQFCGLRHSDMLWVLDAREQADFEAWVAEEQARQGVNPEELAAAKESD